MNGEIAFVVGDSFAATSGLTYVAKNMMRILKEMGYRVFYLSCSGKQHDNTNEAVYIGNSTKNFDEQVLNYKPSLVLTVHDPWMLVYTMLSQYRHTFTLIMYQPVEAPYYPPQVIYNGPDEPNSIKPLPIADVCQRADYVIAYNSFGAQGLRAMGVNVRAEIPNGMSRDKVFKIDDQQVIQQRRAVIGVQPDEILFMHMGRNSTRKRQDIMLEAWQKFLKMGVEKLGNKPKAKLYMHTDRYALNGLDIPSILHRLKILDTVTMPNNIDFSDQDLNLFYNACDVYVGLPAGEGHGYGFAEAMACGKPLIYGNYGGHTTFCEGSGIAVNPLVFISAQNIDAPRAIINPNKAAEAMFTMYLDEEGRKRYGEVGYRKAQELYWNELDGKFKACIEEAVTETKRPSIFARKVV